MVSQGMSIAEAAQALGVSTRTIRRFIKAGKIQANLTPGPFGEEYRIAQFPPELLKAKGKEELLNQDKTEEKSEGNGSVQTASQAVVRTLENVTGAESQELPQSHPQLLELVKKLQEMNLALAAQLGAATERIRNLENQVKLIAAPPRLPWWKRLFGLK